MNEFNLFAQSLSVHIEDICTLWNDNHENHFSGVAQKGISKEGQKGLLHEIVQQRTNSGAAWFDMEV